MWMNLDQLPAGKSMYTVYVTNDPDGTPREQIAAEEVDVVGKRSARSWGDLRLEGRVHPSGEDATEYITEMYGEDVRIIGVVNQSDGYVVVDYLADEEAQR